MTDAEILNLLRSGDEETTREYFYNWCRMAFAVCDEKYNLWQKEGMDFYSLSHDFYLRLALDEWRSPERRSHGMKLSTWMVNGFRYVVLDRLKADARHEADMRLADIDIADEGLSEEVQRLLNDLINGTYADDSTAQTILQSILIDGYSGKETAKRLGISPSAVSQRFKSMMDHTVRPFFMRYIESPGAIRMSSSAMISEDYDKGITGSVYAEGEAKRSAPHPRTFLRKNNMANIFEKIFRRHSSQDAHDGAETYAESRNTPEVITTLGDNEIFVFGSNLRGMHGGGAARMAYKSFGAEWGVGVGPAGRTYAIPTMQGGTATIAPYVDDFVAYAKQHPEQRFLVTRIGCGIAGFDDGDIAPLFAEAVEVENIALPESFWKVLREENEYN